mmetsp:Transcript_35746/g.112869  ORF Transcript_35746/g.112869 Transcript_35746/m.112869 type:complete len:412 (-) Transcript_35746:256-1491(-)
MRASPSRASADRKAAAASSTPAIASLASAAAAATEAASAAASRDAVSRTSLSRTPLSSVGGSCSIAVTIAAARGGNASSAATSSATVPHSSRAASASAAASGPRAGVAAKEANEENLCTRALWAPREMRLSPAMAWKHTYPPASNSFRSVKSSRRHTLISSAEVVMVLMSEEKATWSTSESSATPIFFSGVKVEPLRTRNAPFSHPTAMRPSGTAWMHVTVTSAPPPAMGTRLKSSPVATSRTSILPSHEPVRNCPGAPRAMQYNHSPPCASSHVHTTSPVRALTLSMFDEVEQTSTCTPSSQATIPVSGIPSLTLTSETSVPPRSYARTSPSHPADTIRVSSLISASFRNFSGAVLPKSSMGLVTRSIVCIGLAFMSTAYSVASVLAYSQPSLVTTPPMRTPSEFMKTSS